MFKMLPFKIEDVVTIVGKFKTEGSVLKKVTGFHQLTLDAIVFELKLSNNATYYLFAVDYFSDEFSRARKCIDALAAGNYYDQRDKIEGEFLYLDRPIVERIIHEPKEGVIYDEDYSREQLNKVLHLDDLNIEWGVYRYAVLFKTNGRKQ